MPVHIPFELPLQFVPRLAAGDIVRFGTILKDSGTGRIVGHLQESGVAQSLLSQVLSSAPSPVSAVLSVVETSASVYTAVQVRQLKAMMETLQLLQAASLGVSLVGVGVSVASFLYMRQRFDGLDGRLDAIARTMKEGFERLAKANVRQQVSRTKSLVQRAEIARSMKDSARDFREIAAKLADQAAYFEGELSSQMSEPGPIHHESFWMLAQLWMLCNSVRIDCLIRANELLNAQQASEHIATEYQRLFEQVGPASFDIDHLQGRTTVRLLRDATDAAHSKPFLLDDLRTRHVDGADFIDQLEREREHAMLVVSVT